MVQFCVAILDTHHSAHGKQNHHPETKKSGPDDIKLLSGSTQLSTNFFLLKYIKMPTVVGILTFMGWKNSIRGLSEPEKRTEFLRLFLFSLMSIFKISCSAELSMEKFYNLGPRANNICSDFSITVLNWLH